MIEASILLYQSFIRPDAILLTGRFWRIALIGYSIVSKLSIYIE